MNAVSVNGGQLRHARRRDDGLRIRLLGEKADANDDQGNQHGQQNGRANQFFRMFLEIAQPERGLPLNIAEEFLEKRRSGGFHMDNYDYL